MYTRASAALVALVFPCVASAEFYAGVRTGVAYTDNAQLQDDDKTSDTILYVAPTVGWNLDTRRVTTDVRYQPQFVYRERDNSSDAFHLFNGSVLTEILPEFFFIDFSGSRTQSIIDSQSTLPTADLLDQVDNRDDHTNVSVTPRVERRFGNNVDVFARYTKFWDWVDNPNRFDSDGARANANINNFPQQTRVTWKAEYELREVDFEGVQPLFRYQEARGELGLRVTNALRVFVGGGRETDYGEDPFNTGLDAEFYDAGFDWNPNDRLSVSASGSERSFGKSGDANIQYSFKRGSTSLRYYERVTTRPVDFVGRTPDRRTGGIDGLLDQVGSSDRFVAQTIEWYLNIQGRNNRVQLRVFDEEHNRRTALDGSPLAEESELGARVTWSRDLNQRTNVEVAGEFARLETGIERLERDFYSLSARLVYKITPKLDMSVFAGHTATDAKDPVLESYARNLIKVDLGYSF